MNPTEYYKAGRLQEAIQAQIHEVKDHPLDQGKRLFLFELLAFAGELERARRQIEAISYDDADLERAAASYCKLLDSEQARRDLFEKSRSPGFFGEPPEHLRLRLAAVNRLRENDLLEAARTLERALDATPAVQGTLNGRPFQSLRDEDDLYSGVLEVMTQGRYFWVGLEQISVLTINPPRFPRDLLYIPAHLALADEEGDVYLPALYPGSHEHPDDQVKLGRMTDWAPVGDAFARAVGLHTFLLDDEPIGLLEWRELTAEPRSELQTGTEPGAPPQG
jgi:type VI secretion system protein ImpE